MSFQNGGGRGRGRFNNRDDNNQELGGPNHKRVVVDGGPQSYSYGRGRGRRGLNNKPPHHVANQYHQHQHHNNYDHYQHMNNGVGGGGAAISNGHADDDLTSQQSSEASLTNFFNFPSKPLPVIATPPDKWTKKDAATKHKQQHQGTTDSSASTDVNDEDNWLSTREVAKNSSTSDDNKDYVAFYLERAEQKAALLSLHEGFYNTAEPPREPSILGTIPERNHEGGGGARGAINGNNDNNSADGQVFWKYRMDDRRVDTSHLVINRYEQQITDILDKKQVLIVEGFTGCGKTTQVPQFILDHAAQNMRRVRVAVTQPRRIAAISVANRVCEERGWPLGALVGYQVGMDRKVTDDTRVTYMTTGVLLQLLINKKNLTEYTHIIIDEVHERDLDTDLLLLVIKKIILDRRDTETKIILMSATLNTDKFLKYFPKLTTLVPPPAGPSRGRGGSAAHLDKKVNKEVISTASVISVSQPSAFEVVEIYLDELSTRFGFEGFEVDGTEEPKIYAECYELACRIINGLDYHEYVEECKRIKSTPGEMTDVEKGAFTTSEFYRKRQEKPPTRGAVLVFLPGFLEIDTLYKQLLELSVVKTGNYNRPDVAKWTLYPLHSSVTAEEQQKVFKPAAAGYRKIILATNIAESSITVPDIKYVIDFCLTKSLSCDPSTNFTCLRLEWASRNQCIQRRGRCGRVAPGICYRLISESFYRGLMPQEALPEMERASLESVVLNVKQLEMGSPLEVLAHAIDPPKKSGIKRAVNNLKEVGALNLTINGRYDAYDGDKTYMGSVIAKLPIDFRLGRLIVLGHVMGCVDDAVIIAAALSTKSPFSHPYAKRLEAWLSKFGWSNRTYSDCFALLNTFYTWSQNHRNHVFRTFTEEKNWARTYYVQLSVIREIGKVVDEIKKRLQNIGIFSDAFALPSLERGFILKLLIAGAFYPNYFGRPRPTRKDYERDTIREVGGFNPLSSVVFQGFPIDQPAELYARHIADKMAYTNCIPHINFKSSKVIVSFDPRGDKIGSISYGVYRALKMRYLRDRVTFFTLPREDAKKSFIAGSDFFQEHPVVQAPKSVSLPSIQETQFTCIVSHVSDTESPHEFYVMRQEDDICLAQINEILNSETGCTARQRLKALAPDDCQPGAICIIMKKKRYVRCRIESLMLDQVLVYAIDVGMILWRKFQQVFQVTEEMIKRGLLRFPPLAIPCRLSELKPSCRHAHDWVHQACQDFSTFLDISENQFIFKVYSVVDGIVAGELYSPLMDQTLNQLFLRKTYLEKTTESQDSVDNNNYRRLVNIMRYEDERIKAIDGRQAGNWEPTRYVNPPKLTPDNGTEVTLRGPNSPLEMNFTSLCRSAHMKQVQVEGSSVNCVALDTEPFNPCSRVMVSASIGIAHKSGNLLARETTIMPPIPGLLSLLTLVFAPRLEFRLDPEQTQYTGCVSGLGTDPDGHPVYGDHDMEVIFDVKIDNDDLDLINSIRLTCNMLLREYSGQHSTLESLREKFRTELTQLLQRDRPSVEEIWPTTTHVWNCLGDEVDYHHTHDECTVLDNDVFSLHVGVQLRPPGDGEAIPPNNVFQPPFEFI